MMYGFCGAVWLSAISFCCAGLKAEVPTSVLGGLDLDASRVIYAIGSLSSAGLIHTLININYISPSTDAADHNCFLPITSLNTDYHRNIYLAGVAPHFEGIRHKVVAAISSGTVRVGDHPDFLAPVLCDELGGHQDFPHANIANDLTYKQRS